jgi:Fur family transcriptional regulator, peroxide stress response regulator
MPRAHEGGATSPGARERTGTRRASAEPGGRAQNVASGPHATDQRLREALEANGQRFTEQRAAVYRFLRETQGHPSADDVFTSVRQVITDISLATVYKSLETLVSCGLASKLTYGDGSARYDGRTDPHPHARCLECDAVLDLPGHLEATALASLGQLPGFTVEGYRVEVIGVCGTCHQTAEAA